MVLKKRLGDIGTSMSPLNIHLKNLPQDLVKQLETEFQKLHQEYFLGHWEPSQLDGGRFAEIVLRILEYKNIGIYTPIGIQLNRPTIVSTLRQNTNLDESLRFQALGLTELVLDFRNKRNVAHPGTVDVNAMDSVFVISSANWIVAELIRLETQMDPDEAQAEIKKIIERKIPIVEEIGGRLKCLNPSLDVVQKSLVFCYQKYPAPISLEDLFAWTKYSNKVVLRKKLEKVDKNDGLIDYKDDLVSLTIKGLMWVEKNISFEIDV